MITDGVDDVAAAKDMPKAEVLDVAQLLLGSLDTSSVTLPEKGTAAKEAEERPREGRSGPAKVEKAAPAEAADRKPNAGSRRGRRRRPPTETKPVTGLGIAGGAKRPGAKKARSRACRRRPRSAAAARSPPRPLPPRDSASPRAPSDPALRRRPPRRPRRRPKPPPSAAAEAPAKAEPEVKGLGIAAGARRPGAKKAPAAPAQAKPSACRAEAEAPSLRRAPGGTRRARARGQGTWHRAGRTPARRQEGTCRSPQPKPAAPQPEPETDGESAAAPEPSSEGNGEQPQVAAGEGPRHRQGCTPARQALTSAEHHSPVSIGKFDLPSMRRWST